MDFKVPKELVDNYVVNRRDEIKILRELLVIKDYDMIASKGHNIMGNAASFGFPDLGIMAKEMQDAAIDKHEQKVAQCISNMESTLKKVSVL